ncbi:MAG: hypothetical protein A2X34_09705 [Elusimicrobia bacterium GWC2_51_8]|nr:MAG: hypothetical protein A2X33_10155 [Elusimicrobia bacterium GWA2_51_34]OGR61139.1 MAG: hypothetical protein A2X34_09705 [Elusimicrobia bacterium GWC2_51_8]OGR84725.1 MAG: hypothetical protein A2021_03870 [Elusimicrobia bacterium GWF2_52_66]
MRLDERGRPGLEQLEAIKQRILGLIEEMKVAHPERLRKAYNEHYRQGQKIAWITMRKYLNQLKNESKIREEIISKGKKRTISLIRANF